MECLMTFLVCFLGAFLIPSVKSDEPQSISFCDQANQQYYQGYAAECKHGYIFGEKVPACYCFRGIYRIYYSNCQTKEEFSDEHCLYANDENYNGKIVSVQFIPIPDWSLTHLVFKNRQPNGLTSWEIQTLPAKGDLHFKSNVLDFWLMRANAFLVKDQGKGKLSLCLEKRVHTSAISPFICRLTQTGNVNNWPVTREIDITFTNGNCTADFQPKNGTVKKLHTEACSFYKTGDTGSYGTCMLGCNRTDPHVLQHCTSALAEQIYNNEYLHRQMVTHALKIQLFESEPIMLAQPNCTFDLFMQMVGITRNFCDHDYVSTTWVNYMAELFYVLHKGREFQYVDLMTENDCLWIRHILSTCSANNHTINMTSTTEGDQCPAGHVGGIAWGYCEAGDKDCKKPIRIDPIDSKQSLVLKSKHYVPELAWNVVDAIQAICFHEFRSSYRMYHILEQAMEKLFTRAIRNLWHRPTYSTADGQNDEDNIKKTRLVGPSADEHMRNLEICIGAAYHQTNKANLKHKNEKDVLQIKRLVRPPQPVYLKRKKRQETPVSPTNLGNPQLLTPKPPQSLSQRVDIYCAKKQTEFRIEEKCRTETEILSKSLNNDPNPSNEPIVFDKK